MLELKMQREDMIAMNKESREDLTEKVQRAKELTKQGEVLRRFMEREGIYNLL